MRRALELGGMLAAVVLIAFGVGAIVMGADGRSTVHNSLAEQRIVGTPDMTPTAIKAEAAKSGLDVSKLSIPTCTVAGKRIESGSQARCFAQYMTIHALEATGGLYYSQMPRYSTADGKGTDVESQALKTPKGTPVNNPAREVWVQETALAGALNSSYMATQVGLFGIVVGIALLLSGLGFAILSIAGALRNPESVLHSLRSRREHHGGGATAAPTGA